MAQQSSSASSTVPPSRAAPWPGGRGPAAPGRQGGRVLCLADDPGLRAELLALGRDVGAGVEALTSVPTAADWRSAALVLLDGHAVARVRHLPRRGGVVLVHTDPQGDEPGPEVWRRAVAAGAERVVVLPLARAWLAEAVRAAGRPRGRCVAVVGARGGAGATTAAVALSTTAAAAGHRVLLLDADPLGGGIDLALGAEDLPGMRWPDLHDLAPPVPPGGLAAALPVADEVVLLSYGRAGPPVPATAVGTALQAGLDEHDLVVVDLPRCGDDGSRAAAAVADVLLCVCPAEVRAGAAAPSVLRGWAAEAPVHLLVRGPSPGGLRPRDAAAAVGAGLAVGERLARVDVVRAEPGLAAALERGEAFAVSPRSPLRRWAAGWLAELMSAGARDAA